MARGAIFWEESQVEEVDQRRAWVWETGTEERGRRAGVWGEEATVGRSTLYSPESEAVHKESAVMAAPLGIFPGSPTNHITNSLMTSRFFLCEREEAHGPYVSV